MHEYSQKRINNREFNNIIELIGIFSADYLKKYTTLTMCTPFDNEIKIGRFDNSGKKSLQLKISTNGGMDGNNTHPGTNNRGDKWLHYKTWVHYLDQIDSVERDYSPELNKLGLFSTTFNTHKDVKNNNDFEILIAQMDEQLDQENNKKAANRLNGILEKIQKTGKMKIRLAESLLACLAWMPKEVNISYEDESEIPEILSRMIKKMRSVLKLDDLQPEQARAADSFFFVAVCENFRIPGAVKYMRSCLRHLIENNLSFTQEFGSTSGKTICTLSPKGGTKLTRKCLQTGDISELVPKQQEAYDYLSSASEDDYEDNILPGRKL